MFLNSTQQNKAYHYARSRQSYTVSLTPFYVMRPIFDMLSKVLKESIKRKRQT